jgi:hypothetical protein
MAYRPPQKRTTGTGTGNATAPVKAKKDEFPTLVKAKKDEFPALTPAPIVKETKMNFASLFKNVLKKKNKVKKLKWGTVLLTKKGRIDSLTAEERAAEEEWKDEEIQDNHLWKVCCRLDKQQNLRREFDPKYESPDELEVSESESEVEEEEEVLTDEYEEDEFEPEI